MKISRKEFLRLSVIAGTGLVLPFCTVACSRRRNGDDPDSVGTGELLRSTARLPPPFRVPLPRPSVIKPMRSDGSADYYEITQRRAKVEILPGLKTEIWGYNGMFPGPTIESRSGRRTIVRHRNELSVPTVVHLHGGKTAPRHDGYPTDLVLPVGGWKLVHGGHAPAHRISDWAFDYEYPLEQPAATLWYHDHRMDFTGPQVYRGLAGFHLVHDDEEERLPLPKGERDIPLMICDRSFAEDGSLQYPSIDPELRGKPGVEGEFMEGVLGDVILVNGAPWPYLEVTNTRYRFRLLNASNARRYRLTLDPPTREEPAFIQIGSDVGLLAGPLSHRKIEIGPAERFDVVIDFSSYPIGSEVILRNEYGQDGIGQVMSFRVARKAKNESRVPSRLVHFETLSRSAASITRDFLFERTDKGRHEIWTINGKPFDPGRIDAAPKLGATEIWRLRTEEDHPIHLHLAHFQVLSRNGRKPGPYDAGWKDTIDLRDKEESEIIAEFTGFRGRYVFHCHNLEHEDMAMMANLEVV